MAKFDWGMHIEAWEASGLSQAAYCRRQGLSAGYFSQRLRAHRASPVVGGQVLIPLRVEPEVSATGRLVLHRDAGQRLEIPVSVSPRWVAELLQCLG
jgi:hypothetical protein